VKGEERRLDKKRLFTLHNSLFLSQVHGCMMVLAWLAFASSGMLVARYHFDHFYNLIKDRMVATSGPEIFELTLLT
jgi:hypothetical protein